MAASPSPIWYHPDDDRKPVAQRQTPALVSSLRSIALVDVSGSTAGAILAAEKRLVHDFDSTAVVAWDTVASLLTRAEFCDAGAAGGGTEPSALYRARHVVEAMRSSSLLVFSTDGDVGAAEVNEFSQQCGDHFGHAALIVCVLCTLRSGHNSRPDTTNVSVFAPLLAFPNVVLLHLDAAARAASPDYRVMSLSPGVRQLMLSHHWRFSDQRLLPTVEFDLTSWAALPSVTPAELRAVYVDPEVEAVRLRPGYRLMSNGQALHFDALMATAPILALQSPGDWQRLVSEMSSIAHLAKNEGRIPQLRQWVDKQRYELHQRAAARKEAITNADASVSALRTSVDEIMTRMHSRVSRATEAGASGDGAAVPADHFTQLRLDLKNERAALTAALDGVKERCAVDEELQLLSGYLADTNEWLAMLQGVEKSSYSSSDVLRSLGNRAMRAARVEQIDVEDGLAAVDWSGAPLVECRICLETEHACIVLRYDPAKPELRKEAIELNDTDFAMNWPLACGRSNLLFLSSDVYCYSCAQHLWDNGRQDTVRSTIAGLMPVAPWGPRQNRQLYLSTLAHALGDGRQLPHLFLLYFALLDAATTKEWTADYRHVLQYVHSEMLDHVNATSNFQETGRKVTLGAAMRLLSSNDGLPDLMRQPVEAVFVIIRHSLLSDYRQVNQPDIGKLTFIHATLVARYLRVLVERYCQLVRPNGTADENLQKEGTLLRQLFDALYDCEGLGIPKHGTGRLVREPQSGPRPAILESLMPSSLKRVIDADWQRLWQALRAGHLPEETADHFASQNAPVPDIAPPAALTLLLKSLIGLQYLPVEQLLDGANTRFAQLSTWFLLADKTEVVAGLNAHMFRRLPSFEQLAEHAGPHSSYRGDEVPAFVNVHGASTLFCGCGFCFFDGEMQALRGDSLADAIRTRRGLHFQQAYGSCNPSELSVHVHLHRTVMAVVRDAFSPPAAEATQGEQPRDLLVANPVPIIPDKPTREMVIQTLSRLYKRGIGAMRGNVFRAELLAQVVVLLTDYLRVWRSVWDSHRVDSDAFTKAQWKRPLSLAEKIRCELGLDGCDDAAWWQGEGLLLARRRAVNLSTRDADPELSAPLTTEEMKRVLPTAAVKAAFR